MITVNNDNNRIKIELGEKFSRYRSEHSGKKRIGYPEELREQVRAAIKLNMSYEEVAKACEISYHTVKKWVQPQEKPRVKKLELEPTNVSATAQATIHINDRIVIQIPVSDLVRELVSITSS